MFLLIIRLLMVVIITFSLGKLVARFKLPAILGWLLGGMILGPHALGLIDDTILTNSVYQSILRVLECAVGLMIGTELVFKELKKSGKQILITTVTQSLGTFFFVTLCFSLIFYFIEIPLYLAFLFGGIALATAPAPALSIVREFKTEGPVTRALIPMAALDDILAIIVFISINTYVAAMNMPQSSSLIMTLATMILLPILIGIVGGSVAGVLLQKNRSKRGTLLLTSSLILLVSGLGFIFNELVLAEPVLNFMLIGMAFAGTFANMIPKKRLVEVMSAFQPVLGFSMLMVILNLGAPLDYHLILGAGLFTLIYIVSRGIGKYGGAFIGARMTGFPKTVEKYLGLTLLPHSGVSLVFTGIAVNSLNAFDPESAVIIQGTIAAAAVINEIIAVVIAKKAFEWAGELNKKDF